MEKEIKWDEVSTLLEKACELVGIDLSDSDDFTFFMNRGGISVSWYSTVEHPKYGHSDVYFKRQSNE